MDEYVSIQARPSAAAEWEHWNSVPAWAVLDDREMARVQRAHVRTLCRTYWGQDSPVLLRVVDADGRVVA